MGLSKASYSRLSNGVSRLSRVCDIGATASRDFNSDRNTVHKPLLACDGLQPSAAGSDSPRRRHCSSDGRLAAGELIVLGGDQPRRPGADPAWRHDACLCVACILPVGPAASNSDTRAGWTAGAGVEHKFTSNWSGKLEYLSMDFGTKTFFAGTANQADVGFHDHILRAGINYEFRAGPVVAKY